MDAFFYVKYNLLQKIKNIGGANRKSNVKYPYKENSKIRILYNEKNLFLEFYEQANNAMAYRIKCGRDQ